MTGDKLYVARKSSPASLSRTRWTASETAIRAGWAFSVSVSVSAGPSKMMLLSFATKRLVNLFENPLRGGEILKRGPCPSLRPGCLAPKYESDRHALSVNLCGNRAERHLR